MLSCARSSIGIDPGKSGAVALLKGGSPFVWRDFKELLDIERAIDSSAIMAGAPLGGIPRILIEQVHAMPGQGVTSMFHFGEAYGVAQGAVWRTWGPILEYVSPQKWQNWYRAVLDIGREEEFDSMGIAASLFPEHAKLFKRVSMDHNTADAVLIALYGLATTSPGPESRS